MSGVRQRDFHNLLRVMLGIDHHEVSFMSGDVYTAFARDPYRFFIRCDDETADKIWAAVEKRAPDPAPAGAV